MNEYQTPITKELLAGLPQEVQDQLLDALNNIEFIRRLVSPTRGYAKDRPRDSEGKIIVDLANPHILQDTDYFRPSAIAFKKNGGAYTLLKPNANPSSAYGKWIREERRRCWKGYIRPIDGEWIPGPLYFYMNYCPIIQSKIRIGTKQADRVIDFPEMWEGIYWRFHYMDQARNGGIYNDFLGGNQGAELASRGKSKSYSMAAILAHNFILGETELSCEGTTSLATASQKEYLIKDGVLNKFVSMANFCAQHTQFPRRKLKQSLQDMTWIMGYKDAELDIEQGTLNSVIGVSSKDDESKTRGKRAVFIGVEEFGCHLKGTKVLMYDGNIKNVEDIQIGDQLMGDDNTSRLVQELYSGTDQLYKITLSNGDYQIVNSHHPVYFKKYNWHNSSYTESTLTAPELLQIKGLNKGYYIPKAIINFPYKPVEINPYYLGLWLGDGDSTRLDVANEDPEVLDWLSQNYEGYIRDLNQSETCKVFHMSKVTHEYNASFLKYKLLNNKHIPHVYKINRSDIQLGVVAGLIDSDGTYNKSKNFFEITQRYNRRHILDDIKFMCEANGLKCAMSTRISNGKKKGILHYRLRISGDLSIIPTKIERKKGVKVTSYKGRNCWNDYTFKVEPYKVDEYYGFTVDKNHLFVLGDLTITHNTFPRLIDLYNVMIPSVQEGDIVFGLMYLQGTAGDSESDFSGAQEIMYNPKGYNMYALPNVFDRNNQGKRDFVFFFPGYVNRKGCYNNDGVSDVVKSLIEVLMNRYRVKYNSTDPNTVIKTIAEVPITPAEAIVKTGVNMFPVTDLTERLSQIDNNPTEYDDVYVGELVINRSGEIEYKPNSDKPIREFPHKDNKMMGAIEMFQLPVIDKSTTKPYANRYILGCLKEGELINTDSGLKKVEVVTLQDKLINTDGNFVSIKNCQRYYNSNPVYKVKLSNIYDSTTFSEEHPIYCATPKRKYRGKVTCAKTGLPQRYYDMDFQFRRVADLKVGDYVKSPIPYKEVKYTDISDPDIWYLIGVILGDGWASCNNHNINIAFNSKEQYLISKVQNIVETKLHRKFSVVKDVGTCKEYSFCSSEFNKFISDNFGRGATKKHIPENFKYLPYDCRKSLILGYIDTDGCISNRGIEIVSVSKVLLNDIQDLLFSLKIVSSIKLLSKEGSVFIMWRECHTSNKYELLIGLEGVSKIKSWTYNSMKVGNFVMPSITNHNRKYVYIDDDYIYLRVNSIDVEEYTGYVYNFECETHTFMCNYIPTHNCDPYDDDSSDTMSLGSVWVLDLWTDSIVAEYTGRPVTAEEFYEICRRLCLFYNGRMNYENNKKGLFGYFSARNSLYLLTDILEFLKDKQMMKEGFGNKAKGTNASAPINAYAKNLLRS